MPTGPTASPIQPSGSWLRRIGVGPDRIGWAVEDRLRLGSHPCRQPVPLLLGAWRWARRHATTGPSPSRPRGARCPSRRSSPSRRCSQFHARFGERLYGKYGFKDAFNLSFAEAPSDKPGWFDDQYVAIDQGPILLMIREPPLRSGLESHQGQRLPAAPALTRAGFTGGWLERTPTPRAYGSMIRDTGAPRAESGAIRTSRVAAPRPLSSEYSRTRAPPC